MRTVVIETLAKITVPKIIDVHTKDTRNAQVEQHRYIYGTKITSRRWRYLASLGRISNGGTWSKIIRIEEDPLVASKNTGSMIRRHVGDGSNTLFWKQAWFGLIPFKNLFPHLYSIESQKNCTIAQRIIKDVGDNITFRWEWNRMSLNYNLSQECQDLEEMVLNYNFRSGSDVWIWNVDGNNKFSTKLCRDWIEDQHGLAPVHNIFWLKWVPPKVLCLVWRLSLNRVPVLVNLGSRGIQLQSLRCPLCLLEDEDEEHLFFRCPLAQEIWRRISWWAGVDFVYSGSIHNILTSIRDGSVVGFKKKIQMLIVSFSIWSIWFCRNNWSFKRVRRSTDCLVDEIKSQAFTWVNQRGKKLATEWEK
ncbi:hypothetical protein E3N88_28667 [Mikania micrantha]|uniref:Reverse transcriptase zinc-binding domain-containing protein n=1 Tax=Mikania micrantha TaxID=192012 RepID=A0A5N6N142_9ASTR|nr:hypothetical protein E3N88_28667 [Mikania micrantha]